MKRQNISVRKHFCEILLQFGKKIEAKELEQERERERESEKNETSFCAWHKQHAKNSMNNLPRNLYEKQGATKAIPVLWVKGSK